MPVSDLFPCWQLLMVLVYSIILFLLKSCKWLTQIKRDAVGWRAEIHWGNGSQRRNSPWEAGKDERKSKVLKGEARTGTTETCARKVWPKMEVNWF